MSAAQEEFQRAIEDAIAELAPDLTASGEVLVGGDVVKTLADLRDTSFDALFMGSRGYGPVRRVLLGGVSAGLMRPARRTCCCRAALWLSRPDSRCHTLSNDCRMHGLHFGGANLGTRAPLPLPACRQSSSRRTVLLEGGIVEPLAALGPDDVDMLVCDSRGYGQVRQVLLGGLLAADPAPGCPLPSCHGQLPRPPSSSRFGRPGRLELPVDGTR